MAAAWADSILSPGWKGEGPLSNACMMLSWIKDLWRGKKGFGTGKGQWDGGGGSDESRVEGRGLEEGQEKAIS